MSTKSFSGSHEHQPSLPEDKGVRDGKKDRKDAPSLRLSYPAHIPLVLNFAEDLEKSVTFAGETGHVLVKLLAAGPSWKGFSVLTDMGSPNLWEATSGVLREVAALASYPLPYYPVRALEGKTDVATLHSCYRPILLGIAQRIRRHINVIVLRDDAFQRSGGATPDSIYIASSLPRDQEVGPDYIILRSIAQSVFIYVIIGSDGIFYPLVIVLPNPDGKSSKWHRFIPQALLLDHDTLLDQAALLTLYTKLLTPP